MPKKPVKKIKKVTTPKEEEVNDEEESLDEPISAKTAKIVEVDDAEPVVGIVEEKLDEDAPVTEDEDDALTDDAGIDDEEIDPFGDKWEQ